MYDELVPNSFCIVNTDDIVPHHPITFGFGNHGHRVTIDVKGGGKETDTLLEQAEGILVEFKNLFFGKAVEAHLCPAYQASFKTAADHYADSGYLHI